MAGAVGASEQLMDDMVKLVHEVEKRDDAEKKLAMLLKPVFCCLPQKLSVVKLRELVQTASACDAKGPAVKAALARLELLEKEEKAKAKVGSAGSARRPPARRSPPHTQPEISSRSHPSMEACLPLRPVGGKPISRA